MSWFRKLMPSKIRTEGGNKKDGARRAMDQVRVCYAVLYRAEMERNLEVCPKCGHHMRIDARRRLEMFWIPSLARNRGGD